MKTLCLLFIMTIAAPCALAQRGVDLLLDAEGVRRTGKTTELTTGEQFTPDFSNGWGAGAGFNWWLGDRVSLEAKASGFRSRLRVTTRGSDFVAQADLGHAQIYPIMAVLQWHPMEHGVLRPQESIPSLCLRPSRSPFRRLLPSQKPPCAMRARTRNWVKNMPNEPARIM